MNSSYPQYKLNDQIIIELTNGTKREGVFKTANENNILILANNAITEIPLTSLKSKYRIRCDKSERATIRNKIAHNRALTFLMGNPTQTKSATTTTRVLGKKVNGSQNKSLSN